MSEFDKHVGIGKPATASSPAFGANGGQTQSRDSLLNSASATAEQVGATAPVQPGSGKAPKGAGEGAQEFTNFTPSTEAELKEPSIEAGLDTMQDELTRGTERAEVDPDKGAGVESGKTAGGNPGAGWLLLGVAALVVGALVLRPRRPRA